jgi:tetratricopeptide (TPR) repeat protein
MPHALERGADLPHASSAASFKVAAKHLFRHLHDPHALKTNAIVRHLFADAAATGLGHVPEGAVLDRIHQLVRRGADRCREADLLTSYDERAIRQHKIVMHQCLEGRPIREVATALGISFRHCYRERAAICERIARYIAESQEPPTLDHSARLDEFQFLMDRAIHRAEFGDTGEVLAEWDKVIGQAPSTYRKIEALRASALASIEFGAFDRAENAYADARALFARLPSKPSASRDVAQTCVDLIGSKLSFYRGDMASALDMAQRATTRIEPILSRSLPYVGQLYAEALFETGTVFCNLGNLEGGYDCIVRAEAGLHGVSPASFRLRDRVLVYLWKLRNYLLLSSKSWFPSWERLKGITATFDQAYASSSIPGALSALLVLTEYHAFAGNDDEVLRAARFAVFLAERQPSERVRAQTAITVATQLLPTRHFEVAASLLPGPTGLESCDAFHRELVSHVATELALRSRRFDDAWTLANVEDDRKEYAALTVSRRLIAASAAHELGRRREARALIEAALPRAEELGLAPILKDAYSVAAKVTANSRFKRQASEMARLLIA